MWIAVAAAALAAAVLLAGGITMALRRSRGASMPPNDMSEVRVGKAGNDGSKTSSWNFPFDSHAATADASVDMPLLSLKSALERWV